MLRTQQLTETVSGGTFSFVVLKTLFEEASLTLKEGPYDSAVVDVRQHKANEQMSTSITITLRVADE